MLHNLQEMTSYNFVPDDISWFLLYSFKSILACITHEKWQKRLASNQSKINRSQETKTNISFSHSLRMHVCVSVGIIACV